MASCTRIENLLQAYIDGEVSQSDRVILEQHVGDCRACAALLRRHQRACAHLFESFADDRLRHSLVPDVLEHIPEMERERNTDLQAVNWRAKHPVNRWQMVARFAPAGVLAVLLVLALTIVAKWPEPRIPDATVVGVVTQCSGDAESGASAGSGQRAVAVKDFVKRDQWYETGVGGTLMLTLAGPTQLKLNESTRVRLFDDRKISVESGEIWLDVGRDGRLFHVKTPVGAVTVFGTSFEVAVTRDKTVVTVAQGLVQVENEVTFREIEPGQQVDLAMGKKALVPREVNVASETAWTEPIQPDKSASDLFQKKILPRSSAGVPPVPVYYVFLQNDKSVKGIYLAWKPDEHLTGHCGYDVYVSDPGDKVPLLKEHIEGSLFDNKEIAYLELVSQEAIRDASVLKIKIVPDFSAGQTETMFANVSAIGAQL